jgi:hypothetical protein
MLHTYVRRKGSVLVVAVYGALVLVRSVLCRAYSMSFAAPRKLCRWISLPEERDWGGKRGLGTESKASAGFAYSARPLSYMHMLVSIYRGFVR